MRPSASLRCAERRNRIRGVLTGGCEPLRGYASPRLKYFSRYRGKTTGGRLPFSAILRPIATDLRLPELQRRNPGMLPEKLVEINQA